MVACTRFDNIGSTMLNDTIQLQICQTLGKPNIHQVDTFKTVWSGFGALHRISFAKNDESVVVKSICKPTEIHHPKGWNSDFASARKLSSYRNEQYFYRHYSNKLNVVTPPFLGLLEADNTQYLLLSDLASAGFEAIAEDDISAVKGILDWLACFHAQNLNVSDNKLWQQGGYWHLATRPDELNAMSHTALRAAAPELDNQLRSCPYQTLIHGDAKIANFMMSQNTVAGYDFQYVGKGIGIQDVMLLLSSAFTSEQLYAVEHELLNYYQTAFLKYCDVFAKPGGIEILSCWLALYSVAWADFVRFLEGWSPKHWKLHEYAWHHANKALANIS